MSGWGGNQFQRVLIGPASERLLQVQPDQVILEIACGNGVFSRRLASLGAWVVATDFSATFLDLARARTTEHPERIEYRLVDATDERQLLALGERRFDAAVCNMALMDMVTIEPLMRALARLLKPRGRFVFSLLHPAFNNPGGTRLALEEEDRDGQFVETYYVKVSNYLRVPPVWGVGMVGEPTPHYYFHRSLSVLFGACFTAGFVLDGLEEPAFGPDDRGGRPLNWANYTDVPPVLVARMRPAG
ncbi:MAG TPA: class I SAM-dependent methyltransferase [Chloroflexota bacterium]|nr:class I SAM-dependent methyltransferase [Chloroflexota bacterium]